MPNSIRANQPEGKELLMLANNILYDNRAKLHANIADMRSRLLSEFLYVPNSNLHQDSLIRSVEEVTADMNLINGPSQMRKPLNIGQMFFHEQPDYFFPYARIEVADKPDLTGEGMTEKVFTGPPEKN